jgi:hypothetical protein
MQRHQNYHHIFQNEGMNICEYGMKHSNAEIRTICDSLIKEFAKYDDSFGAFALLISNLKVQIKNSPNLFLPNPSFSAIRHFAEKNEHTCNVLIALGITEALMTGLREDAWQSGCFNLVTYIGNAGLVCTNRMAERHLIPIIGENFNILVFQEKFPELLKNVTYIEPVARLFQFKNVSPIQDEIRGHLLNLMRSRADVFEKKHYLMAKNLNVKKEKEVQEFLEFITALGKKTPVK